MPAASVRLPPAITNPGRLAPDRRRAMAQRNLTELLAGAVVLVVAVGVLVDHDVRDGLEDEGGAVAVCGEDAVGEAGPDVATVATRAVAVFEADLAHIERAKQAGLGHAGGVVVAGEGHVDLQKQRSSATM